MTLQQLRYIIQVAESGSISSAAKILYMRQPSLSKAVSEIEEDLGVRIFERTQQGVMVTEEGDRVLAYARRVVEQADLLESHYVGVAGPRTSLCVSAPHNLLMAEAFAEVISGLEDERYEYILREVPPAMVIDDVRQQRSELGVVYRSEGRRDVMDGAIQEAGLRFAPFATITPRVLVSKGHPLAHFDEVQPDDLLPYPRIMLEWVSPSRVGTVGPLVKLPSSPRIVRATDRQTQRRLVRLLNGYMLFLPLSPLLNVDGDFHAPRISGAYPVEAGVITRPGFPLSPSAEAFRERLIRLGS